MSEWSYEEKKQLLDDVERIRTSLEKIVVKLTPEADRGMV